MLTLILALFVGDTGAALELAKAKILAPKASDSVPAKAASYDSLAQQAVKEGKPLVVGIGCEPIVPQGFLGIRCDDMPGEKGVWVSVPHEGQLKSQLLPASASVRDVQIKASDLTLRLNAPKAVSQAAVPFDNLKSSSGDYLLDLLPTADADKIPASWPVSIPFPKGMVPYTRAKFTQRTFNRGIVEKVPRSLVPPSKTNPKVTWQVSGGMEGVKGFKSEVFKLVPGLLYGQKKWITVENGIFNPGTGRNFTQQEVAYTQSYPDGTMFVDHLTNASSGKAFETRIAEKQNGQWRRYVAFRDEKERPVGYHSLGRLGLTCTTCHNTTDGPGTGGYNVGLVPGSDTVVSDQLIGLER